MYGQTEAAVRAADRHYGEADRLAEHRSRYARRRKNELIALLAGPDQGRGREVSAIYAKSPNGAEVYLLRDFAAWLVGESPDGEAHVMALLLGDRIVAIELYAEDRAWAEAQALDASYFAEAA